MVFGDVILHSLVARNHYHERTSNFVICWEFFDQQFHISVTDLWFSVIIENVFWFKIPC
jgi:hypothetical protein